MRIEFASGTCSTPPAMRSPFAQGRTCEDLARDRQFALALVKCVEIIGEAAGRPALDQDATLFLPHQPEPQSKKGASRP